MYAAPSKKKNIIARIATNSCPCAFCGREVDDEAKYGKLYEIGDVSCHYFCALLSCCLIQKGQDEDGLFGFLYADIVAEIARSKKHKCSFCGCDGANLGCTVSQCKKQFHLPCGREKNAVSMFYGNYKSFCAKHAPKQKISDTVMQKVKSRMAKKRLQNFNKAPSRTTQCSDDDVQEELSCVICYEAVEGCPGVDTFWPPCCGRDAWFHRCCLERMCLSAGVHYLKCPLCNDKEKFREAVLQQGYYIPDRDAAWELEQNAFAEIYNASYGCGTEHCLCPSGRSHDDESGPWDINLCVLCGSVGAHARCRAAVEAEESEAKPYVCPTCTPSAASAPNLIQALHELALQEQAAAVSERVVRPLMPSRMSLRRTKGRPTTSRNANISEEKKEVSNTELSRLELNLKTPRRNLPEPEIMKKEKLSPIEKPGSCEGSNLQALEAIENKLLSPIKQLEPELMKKENKLLSPIKQLGLYERISKLDVDTLNSSDDVIERIRETLKVPQPLAVKRKIVISILEDLMNTTYKDKLKMKEPLREWISPKKCAETKQEKDKMPAIEPTKEDTEVELPKTDKNQDSETQINENVLESPKLKTVDIETDSSMEISNNNNTVNIELTREESTKPLESPLKISFLNLSPNKSKKLNVDIDIESFKMQYLSETSQTNHRKRKFSDNETKIDVYPKEIKRKKHNKENKRKHDKKESVEIKLQFQKECDSNNAIKDRTQKEISKLNKKKNKEKIKIKLKFKKQNFESNNGIRLKKDSYRRKSEKSKTDNKKDEENVKIELKFIEESSKDKERSKSKRGRRLKKERSKLQKDRKKEKRTERESVERKEELKESPKILKQYLLNYSEDKNKSPIVKPQTHVSLKRKYVKKEKVSDNFKQMSLDNFFSSNLSPKDKN